MTFDDFKQQVSLFITPEQPEVTDPRGCLGGKQTFWIHTVGMDKFGAPELEFREVPALFVESAGEILNMISHQIVLQDLEVKDGFLLMVESGPVPVALKAFPSKEDWYSLRNLQAFTLWPDAVMLTCQGDHEHECDCDTKCDGECDPTLH